MKSERTNPTLPEQEPEFFGDDIEIDEKEAEGEFSESYARELSLKEDDKDSPFVELDLDRTAEEIQRKEQVLAQIASEIASKDTQEKAFGKDSEEAAEKAVINLQNDTDESDSESRKNGRQNRKVPKDWKEKEVYSTAAAPAYVRRSPISSWFSTLMIMNLPIIGWFYLLVLALRKNGDQRRDFARAYLVYKLVFFLAALVVIAIAMYFSMGLLDQFLEYINML